MKPFSFRENRGPCKVYENCTFVATVYPPTTPPDFPPLIHISISRKDRGAMMDWREKQFIKNQLVGTENEGVELFPAESRKVDGANQFHLFVLASPGLRFPFGFTERLVSDHSSIPGVTQRPGSGASEEDEKESRKKEEQFFTSLSLLQKREKNT